MTTASTVWPFGTDVDKAQIHAYIQALDAGSRSFGVLSQSVGTPPASPSSGDKYIISGGTGAWSGHDDKIAMYVSTSWSILDAQNGWSAFILDEDISVEFDGSTWVPGVSKKNTAQLFNLLQDAGRFGNSIFNTLSGAFQVPAYIQLLNGTAMTEAGKYIHNSNNLGGTRGTMSQDAVDLITKIRDAAYRQFGVEHYIASVKKGSGTSSSPITTGGITYYICWYNKSQPRLQDMTIHFYVRAKTGNILIKPFSTISVDGAGDSTSNVVITPDDDWVSIRVKSGIDDPRQFFGYSPNYFQCYQASQDDEFLVACMTYMAGSVDIDKDVGVVPAYNNWSL